MSCFACTRRYGFFCKESGCPNCGYSFCTKCLKKEIEVPRCKDAKLKVCLKCFEKLEKEKLKTIENTPKNKPNVTENEILFTIDDPLEVPVMQPINLAGEAVKINLVENDDIKENLDSVISKRLAGLKDNVNPNELPSDSNMANRLANLKGVPFKEYSNTDILLSKDTRTDEHKINDLLQQFAEETAINDKVSNTQNDSILDIERRLLTLRSSENSTSSSNVPTAKEEDEATSVKTIVQRYLDEAKLPEAMISEEEKELIEGLPPPSKDTEELPWCTICNEDAVLRCIGCDGDLFCRACFKECHDDEDFREHQKQTYSKPPNFKENHF